MNIMHGVGIVIRLLLLGVVMLCWLYSIVVLEWWYMDMGIGCFVPLHQQMLGDLQHLDSSFTATIPNTGLVTGIRYVSDGDYKYSWFAYRYKVGDKEYISESVVSGAEVSSIEINSVLRITYGASNPLNAGLNNNSYVDQQVPFPSHCPLPPLPYQLLGASIAGLLFGLLLLTHLVDDYSFERWGINVHAQVVSSWQNTDSYWVQTKFQHNSKVYQKTIDVNTEEFQHIAAGEYRTVTIKYLRSNPERAKKPNPDKGRYGLMLAGMLWLMLPALLFLIALASAGRAVSLIASGCVVSTLSWLQLRYRILPKFGAWLIH